MAGGFERASCSSDCGTAAGASRTHELHLGMNPTAAVSPSPPISKGSPCGREEHSRLTGEQGGTLEEDAQGLSGAGTNLSAPRAPRRGVCVGVGACPETGMEELGQK